MKPPLLPRGAQRPVPFRPEKAHVKLGSVFAILLVLVLVCAAQGQVSNHDSGGSRLIHTAVDCRMPGAAIPGEQLAPGWERSYRSGCLDRNGKLAAGSEILHLVAHKGKLYAAVGYWMDPRNPWYGGSASHGQWAQVLRLDGPTARWQVDLNMPPGHLRTETLQSVTFTTDGSGRSLAAPVTLLLASEFEGGRGNGGVSLFTRDDETGRWTQSKILVGDTGARGEDNSVRAMRVYRDKATGVDRLFVSVGTPGIYSGVYDPALPGKIKWDLKSESGWVPVRPLAIVEANGALFFSAGKLIYRRIDGAQPRYEVIEDLSDLLAGMAVSTDGGIRGLTAIQSPDGNGQSLLFVWVPDNRSRGCVFRLDRTASDTYTRIREACLDQLVSRYLGGAIVPFVLAGYNQILQVPNPATNDASYLIGLEAWVVGDRFPTGYRKGNGGMYSGALYAIRDANAHYRIAEVNGRIARSNPILFGTRDYAVSPFPSDLGQTVYFAGYDCNWVKCSDTAWIFRTSLVNALR